MLSNSRQLPSIVKEVQDLNESKSTVTIKVDNVSIAQISGKLKPYKSFPHTFRPALEKIADYVRITMIPTVFRQEGPGWKRLARRTVAERIQAGFNGQHPILRRSGDLFKELTMKSHPKHIEIIRTGKNVRLEIGGESEKFIQNQLGVNSQRLPARPMIPGTGNIPITDRDRIAMKSIVVKAIQERAHRPR